MPACKEELSTGNIVRVERGCSRRLIAGGSRPLRLGRGETGRTTAHTSMPPSNNARREGHEKVPGIPRKSTRGGRFMNLTEASQSCSISIERTVISIRSYYHATNGQMCQNRKRTSRTG